jgi:hypothetical protein
MRDYDPAVPPDPDEWQALDEVQRINLVLDFHRKSRIKLSNARLHAAIHAVVENQLALGVREVCETLERLMAEGLDRHEAIHAIGQVLTTAMFHGLNDPATGDIDASYRSELETLTAQKWLNQEVD